MSRPPAVDQADREQYDQRDGEQQHRDRRRPRRVVALYLPEDVHRRHLRLEGYVPRYEDDRPELPHGARERQGRAGQDRRQQVGQDDLRERLQTARPERDRRLLHLLVQLQQDGLHRPHHERQRDEQERHHDRRARVGDVHAERALGAVERQERQPGDDGGQGEREVYDRVDYPLPPEGVPYQYPRDKRARDDVDGDDGQRGHDRDPQGGDGLGVRDRAHEPLHAAVGRAPHDGGERYQHYEAEVPGDYPPAYGTTLSALHRRSRLARGLRRGVGAHSVGAPISRLMSAITPFSESKNSSLTVSQPPRSAIVNR